MKHPDAETLVAVAQGEDVGDDVATHLDACASCRHDVDTADDIVRIAHGLGRDPLALERPPDAVWAAIAEELDRDRRTVSPNTGVGPTVPVPAPSPVRRVPRWDPPAEIEPPETWWAARGRTVLATAGGFLAGAAVVALAVVLLDRPAEPRLTQAPDAVASGPLLPLTGQRANGSARVYDLDGQRTIEVRLRDAEVGSSSYVEAWLLQPGTSNMVALGVVDAGTETFAVPDHLDLDVYSDVDISREPFDGDPAHSTKSLARAELTP